MLQDAVISEVHKICDVLHPLEIRGMPVELLAGFFLT